MCRSHHAIEMWLHEERKARKKLQKDMKEVKIVLYPNKTPSTPGSEERESNPPTPFEQRYASYENFDPSQPFAEYACQAFDAPPPLPEQPRPSMADEIAVSIFGYPNPCMASSSHTYLHHTTMPDFFDTSLYIGPGVHWTALHDYAPSNDQEKTRPQAPTNFDASIFDDC
jgi:hypothetical protein